MIRYIRYFSFAALALSSLAQAQDYLEPRAPGRRPTYLLIHGSYGMGHTSAARSVGGDLAARMGYTYADEEALKKDGKIIPPDANVIVKDITSFADPKFVESSKKRYDWLTQMQPLYYEDAWRTSMHLGARMPSLGDMPMTQDFRPMDMLKWIEGYRPDTIVCTFPQCAQVMVFLREKLPADHWFQKIAVGWVHTDLTDEAYFARFCLALDQCFVAVPELRDAFIKRGVPADRVTAAGYPINDLVKRVLSESELDEVLAKYNVKKDMFTVSLLGGSNGVGDFEAQIKSIAKAFPTEPIQIVAACGRNDKLLARVQALQKTLPPNIRLVPHGFILQPDLFAITTLSARHGAVAGKTGGSTPFEMMAIGAAQVMHNPNMGQETDNFDYFKKQKLGFMAESQDGVGAQVRRIYDNPDEVAAMKARGKAFIARNNTQVIADWKMVAKRTESLDRKIHLDLGSHYPKPSDVFSLCVRIWSFIIGR